MFTLNSCPERFPGTEIEELYVKAELAKMTVEQRKIIEEGIMTQNDILNSIEEQLEDAKEKAMADGRAAGWVEGVAKGIAEGRAEIIHNLYSGGLSTGEISKLVGLDLKEIEAML